MQHQARWGLLQRQAEEAYGIWLGCAFAMHRQRSRARISVILALVVEMGESRTPRPRRKRRRYPTGLASVLLKRGGPPLAGFAHASLLVLGSA